MIVVHVTHEAVEKIGGIGAVIAGLATADAYSSKVSRTILVGPLLSNDRPGHKRLGDGGKVIYSSLDDIQTPEWREKFGPIERAYDVGIIYGTREIDDAYNGKKVEAEVLLVDVFHVNHDRLNLFKGELFRKFGIPSHEFQNYWEYEEYVRLAEPGYEAIKALGCNGSSEPKVILAHEYMGMPLALKAVLSGSPNTRTVFYAHEVASVRPVVEDSPGHDTMFYNVLKKASTGKKILEDVFPSVLNNYKHPLVKAARNLDCVFAVGDNVQEELRFLDNHFRQMEMDLVYNGIPAVKITKEQKNASGTRMRDYAQNLTGIRPTWVFSHVCRPVMSKGIWRDLLIMDKLEPMFERRGESAVFFMLGTLAGQRRPQDVRHMVERYGWPVNHEKGYPDLCQGEEVLGDIFAEFNRTHSACKAVFVNQWDWNRQVCGDAMPEDMSLADIRIGTDLEFGLSVYEPFGISQYEPLAFGAICVTSNVCGCMGFARMTSKGKLNGNIIEGDFTALPREMDLDELLNLSIPARDDVEAREGQRIAEEIDARLSRTDKAKWEMVRKGYELARKMSWEHVVDDLFLPSLARAAQSG